MPTKKEPKYKLEEIPSLARMYGMAVYENWITWEEVAPDMLDYARCYYEFYLYQT